MIQCDASGKVDKFEHGKVSVLEVGSGPHIRRVSSAGVVATLGTSGPSVIRIPKNLTFGNGRAGPRIG